MQVNIHTWTPNFESGVLTLQIKKQIIIIGKNLQYIFSWYNVHVHLLKNNTNVSVE